MLKVLIADDEEPICKLISILGPWKELGLEICATVYNGIDALNEIKAQKPDILITDIRMPGLDGMELIAQARALQPQLEIVILSGYAHFEYARTALLYGVSDYLLKPIDKNQLRDALEKCASRCRERHSYSLKRQLPAESREDITRLRNNLIRDLLERQTGEISPEELNRVYHFYAEPKDSAQAVLIKVCTPKPIPSTELLGVLRNSVREILSTELKPLCHDLLIGCREQDLYAVMSFTPSRHPAIRKAIRSCQQQLDVKRTFVESGCFCVSLGSIEPVENLKQSFRNAGLVAMERFVEGTGKLLEKIPDSRLSDYSTSLSQYRKSVQYAVDILDFSAAELALSQLRSQLLACETITGHDLVNVLYSAADIFAACLTEISCDSALTQFRRTCECTYTAELLFDALGEMQKTLLDQIREKHQSEELFPIRKAKQYIKDHYMDPITLDEVAESIGFSSSYFSTFFKKETGTGFNQYLIEVRMDAAKEYLRTSSRSVAEICNLVGYHDLKHFSRVFRKACGMTPGEYRKIC